MSRRQRSAPSIVNYDSLFSLQTWASSETRNLLLEVVAKFLQERILQPMKSLYSSDSAGLSAKGSMAFTQVNIY